MVYAVAKNDKELVGQITLDGSKSLSNRALIIRYLCEEDFEISNLSSSQDTTTLNTLLQSEEKVLDAGAAGTTFRFLTACLALKPGTQILTGSERMKKRPVAPLVDALNQLGASVEYLENKGFPPLKIHPPRQIGDHCSLEMPASVSSQYISALLMIAPVLPNGLKLRLKGKIVSRPYIEMTLSLMRYFGITYTWVENTITVPPQKYMPMPFRVEADWSAASYYYAMAAFSEYADLRLKGVWKESLQGDAVISEIMKQFGVSTLYDEDGLVLKKSALSLPATFEWDFIKCPDIAQTVAVVCGGLGVKGVFSGLETLRIKETDRIEALRIELEKTGVALSALPEEGKEEDARFLIEGQAKFTHAPLFNTYEDHRMAMAFAPLSILHEIQIAEPGVVRKSYPDFWKDIQSLGFEIKSE